MFHFLDSRFCYWRERARPLLSSVRSASTPSVVTDLSHGETSLSSRRASLSGGCIGPILPSALCDSTPAAGDGVAAVVITGRLTATAVAIVATVVASPPPVPAARAAVIAGMSTIGLRFL